MNALDRINNLDKPKTDMSLDEQMAAVDAAESNEFFNGMSPMAKESIMSHSLNNFEVKMEDVKEEFKEEQPQVEEQKVEKEEIKMAENKTSTEEQFNYNTEEKKQRGRPKQKSESITSSEGASAYDPIIAQLAKNIVADLKKQNYSYGGFSASQTKLILDYISKKL